MGTEIFSFLKKLQRNNNRAWFKDNKERYDVLRESFIKEEQTLFNRLSLFDSELARLEAEDCLFSIYRDIRFSLLRYPIKLILLPCHLADVKASVWVINQKSLANLYTIFNMLSLKTELL